MTLGPDPEVEDSEREAVSSQKKGIKEQQMKSEVVLLSNAVVNPVRAQSEQIYICSVVQKKMTLFKSVYNPEKLVFSFQFQVSHRV